MAADQDDGAPGRKLHGFTSKLKKADGWTSALHLPGLNFQVVTGADRGRDWSIGHTTIRIGSHPDNDIVLQDPSVSRFHAQVFRTDGGVRLKDLGSTNGTTLRGGRILDAYVSPGEEFAVGKTVLAVTVSENTIVVVPSPSGKMGPFIGESQELREAFALLRAAACTSAPVVILGESGTGKELAARFLHEESRRDGQLVAFDCARTHPELVQAELFGHRRGAFTGATHDREGAFRRAHRGTLFLDELGELPLAHQSFLLRALETREVQALGDDKSTPVDARIVSATHKNLEQMVRERTFREDLYYRLGVVIVTLPPLRERRSDVPLLVDHFVRTLALPVHFSPEAMERMSAASWPGNIRALRNALERLSVLCRDREIRPADLGFLDGSASGHGPESADPVEGALKKTILETYERMGRNKLRTAKALGISRNRLKRKLMEYQIDED
jgi:DNA-binding NtrC family response regulator